MHFSKLLRGAVLSAATGLASLQAAGSLEEVKALVERGKGRLALEYFTPEVRASDRGEVHFWLGRAQMGAGDGKAAEAAFREAIRLNPEDPESHAWLGNAFGAQASRAGMLSAMGLASRMREAWDRALGLDPGNISARTGYLQFYLAAPGIAGGSIAKAREQVPYIAGQNPYLGDLLLAQIERRDGNDERFEALVGGLIEREPQRREAWTLLGEYLLERKRYSDAFELYARQEVATGSSAVSRFFVGRAAAISGERLEEGERQLRAYIGEPAVSDDAPPVAAAHARLGQVLLHAGRVDEARSSFEEALKLDPALRTAKDGMAEVRKRKR